MGPTRRGLRSGTSFTTRAGLPRLRTMGTITADTVIDDFIRRWAASSGAERANFQSFANELCDLIGVARPDPAHHEAELNDYTFERAIKFKEADGSEAPGRVQCRSAVGRARRIGGTGVRIQW